MKYIQLTKGLQTIVDDEDYKWLAQYNWRAKPGNMGIYYAVRYVKNEKEKIMHREIMNAPSHLLVDHINCNPLDNRRSNLRFANYEENSRNRQKKRAASSKYKGVHWNSKYGKWHAEIYVSNKKIFIGAYRIEEEAARAYDTAARHYHGAFARTNFVD